MRKTNPEQRPTPACDLPPKSLNIVIAGLSITSSWGNGHATTYRALVRELAALGHRVTFLERDTPWYAGHRDAPKPLGCEVVLYNSRHELQRDHLRTVSDADVVVVGSYAPEGIVVGRWVTSVARGVTAFYDIDTPVTLDLLEQARCDYLSPELIPNYDLYFSFTGGPTLELLRDRYGARRPTALYCGVDTEQHVPRPHQLRWDLGYLGTYSEDRQPFLEQLLIEPARSMPGLRFIVAGAKYPADLAWPGNVQRIDHIPPPEHPPFYCGQRFTLNLTRAHMKRLGWSPSVRLFEAAACGVPIISDYWHGIENFFEPGREILLASSPEEVRFYLQNMPDETRRALGARARDRVLREHTAQHRAREFLSHIWAVSSHSQALESSRLLSVRDPQAWA